MPSLRVVFLPLLALLWAASAKAGEPTFVVGVEGIDYMPVYGLKDGAYAGAARDILDAFAQARGYRFKYQPLPIKRLYRELTAGALDFKFPDSPDWAKEAKAGATVVYSGPVIAYVDGTLVPPDRVGRGPEGIGRLGTVQGFTPYAWMDRIKAKTVGLDENLNMDSLLRQTLVGHVDGAYVNVAVAAHRLAKALDKPDGLRFDHALPHVDDHYRLSSVKRPAIIAEFDAWMAANAALVKDIKDRTGAERGLQ